MQPLSFFGCISWSNDCLVIGLRNPIIGCLLPATMSMGYDLHVLVLWETNRNCEIRFSWVMGGRAGGQHSRVTIMVAKVLQCWTPKSGSVCLGKMVLTLLYILFLHLSVFVSLVISRSRSDFEKRSSIQSPTSLHARCRYTRSWQLPLHNLTSRQLISWVNIRTDQPIPPLAPKTIR